MLYALCHNRDVRRLMRYAGAFAVALSLPLLGGCLLLNDVSRVDGPIHRPGSERALVIVGVGMEGDWGAPEFPIRFVEYDMARKTAVGDCWRWNRLEASTSKQIEYFVFDVAPGHYAGGGGNSGVRGNETSPLAFEVPAGRIVYLGDFIYARDHKIDLRRNVRAATETLRNSPTIADGEVVVARAAPVPTLQLFVCTP
jgi:hypothetical protein